MLSKIKLLFKRKSHERLVSRKLLGGNKDEKVQIN